MAPYETTPCPVCRSRSASPQFTHTVRQHRTSTVARSVPTGTVCLSMPSAPIPEGRCPLVHPQSRGWSSRLSSEAAWRHLVLLGRSFPARRLSNPLVLTCCALGLRRPSASLGAEPTPVAALSTVGSWARVQGKGERSKGTEGQRQLCRNAPVPPHPAP